MSANLKEVTVTETPGRAFRSSGVVAFTLVNGLLVGRVKSGGGWVPYAVPALDVVKVYLQTASGREKELVKSLAED